MGKNRTDHEENKFYDDESGESTVRVGATPDGAVDVLDKKLYVIQQVRSSTLTYVCSNFDHDADINDPTWQVCRFVSAGGITIRQAIDDGRFTQICDPDNLFGAVPYINEYALGTNGANKWAWFPHDGDANFDQGDPFSLFAKGKTETTNRTLIEKVDGTTGYTLSIVSNRLVLEIRGTGGTSDRIRVRSDNNLVYTDAEYHSYGASWDGTDAAGVVLYFDGLVIDMDTQDDGLGTSPLNNGIIALAANVNGGNSWDGFSDTYAIWNSVLSDTEFLAVTATSFDLRVDSSPYLSSADLVKWADFTQDDKDNNPVLDDLASGATGTLVNILDGNFSTDTPA